MIQTIFSPFDRFISAGFVAHLILIGTFYYCMREAKEVLASFGKYMYSIVLYWFMIIVFITITRIGEVLSTDGSVVYQYRYYGWYMHYLRFGLEK